MSPLPPLRRQVVVPAGSQVAFDVFTQQIGTWWPVAKFSVHGPAATAAFRDGRLIETGPDGTEAVWRLLSHTPAPEIGDPFAHAGFRGHPAFLAMLRERGVLVAAGPFAASGEGMTVVRLAGPGEVAGLVRSAYEDDASVTGGVLEVRVRPWVVMMSGSSLA